MCIAVSPAIAVKKTQLAAKAKQVTTPVTKQTGTDHEQASAGKQATTTSNKAGTVMKVVEKPATPKASTSIKAGKK